MNTKNQELRIYGFSLLEIMTVIVISTFLMILAIPSFNKFLMRQEREVTLDRLALAIEYAKQEAFFRNKTVTVCASYDRKTCHLGNWSGGFIVFENSNQDPQPKPNTLLQVFSGLHYGQLHFDQFGKNLHIQPNSMTINLGTFVYCPKDRDPLEAAGLTINRLGRTYRPNKTDPEAIPFLCR